jgi:hypothetical protein
VWWGPYLPVGAEGLAARISLLAYKKSPALVAEPDLGNKIFSVVSVLDRVLRLDVVSRLVVFVDKPMIPQHIDRLSHPN